MLAQCLGCTETGWIRAAGSCLLLPLCHNPSTGTVLLPIFSFLTCCCCVPLEKHHCLVLPCPAAAEISLGHRMAEEGREGCWVLLNAPACCFSPPPSALLAGAKSCPSLGLVLLQVLLGHSISPAHPGSFPASQAGVKEGGLWMHPHFFSVLLHFPLPPANSSGKKCNEIAVVMHLLPLKNNNQTTQSKNGHEWS